MRRGFLVDGGGRKTTAVRGVDVDEDTDEGRRRARRGAPPETVDFDVDFEWFNDDDETTAKENVLVLLHGDLDCPENFVRFGKALALPKTAVLARCEAGIQGIDRVRVGRGRSLRGVAAVMGEVWMENTIVLLQTRRYDGRRIIKKLEKDSEAMDARECAVGRSALSLTASARRRCRGRRHSVSVAASAGRAAREGCAFAPRCWPRGSWREAFDKGRSRRRSG